MPSPEHKAFVASLPPGGATPEVLPSPEALAAYREPGPHPQLDGMSVSPAVAGGVPAYWVSETGRPAQRTILYLHGGGYIFMHAQRFVPVMAEIVRAAGARCLGLEYRKAPEHPYPAALEDALSAYRWLLDQGMAPERIALVGDSAGGGLVLATLLAIRDRALPRPGAAACISPWTDLKISGASAERANDPVVSAKALRMMAKTYLAGADAATPYASPLYGDLTGLPPLHIQVGTREALLDDSLRFIERARRAGLDVTCLSHRDVAHMWIFHNVAMPEAQAAFVAIGTFLRAKMPDEPA
jgi:acetyl esterase/lipase